MASTVDLTKLTEYHDPEEVVEDKCRQLALMLRGASHAIAYTGAGISTSAKIPDFRGPEGVWTRQAQGRDGPDCISLRQAVPTPCHNLIKRLVDDGALKYIVSQNIDGLHRRSGVPRDRLSELHGNAFLSVCWGCGYDQENDEEKRSGINMRGKTPCADCRKRVPHFCHCTADKCPKCKQPLRDSIIHFGENLPVAALREAKRQSEIADVCVVMGSSCTVSPANEIPERVAKRLKQLVIINLQVTQLDDLATLRIFAKSDDVAARLTKYLYPAPATVAAAAPPSSLPTAADRSLTMVAPELIIGNRHRLVRGAAADDNQHEWMAFVRPSVGVAVSKVTFTLHPTFTPNVVTVEQPAKGGWNGDGEPEFALSRLGWGTFELVITVDLVPVAGREQRIVRKHMLDFSTDERSAAVAL